MKQILVASLILLLAGCSTSAKGTVSDATYMIEGDQSEIAECIVVELDRLYKKKMDYCGIFCDVTWEDIGVGERHKHYVKKTGDNIYEVHYTGWTSWNDPLYYVKLTKVDNVVLIERFSFYLGANSESWPSEAIAACT